MRSAPMISLPLILASTSPRRRDLLAQTGLPFEIITVEVREHDGRSAPHLSPAQLAEENARLKAQAVAALHPGRRVLGADTVVALGGRIFGKPVSLEQAREFLSVLSGRTHEVITGCAVIDPEGRAKIFHESSHVTFHPLTNDLISRYLAEVHVLDKAGGYALQEKGESIIAGVTGSRSNIIGLPMERLTPWFKKYL